MFCELCSIFASVCIDFSLKFGSKKSISDIFHLVLLDLALIPKRSDRLKGFGDLDVLK